MFAIIPLKLLLLLLVIASVVVFVQKLLALDLIGAVIYLVLAGVFAAIWIWYENRKKKTKTTL